jgi:hypothetical protein
MPVVDCLEVVQVDHHEDELFPASLVARDLPVEGLLEMAVIRDPGERVSERAEARGLVGPGETDCVDSLAGEELEDDPVVLGDGVTLGAGQLEKADELLAGDEGNGDDLAVKGREENGGERGRRAGGGGGAGDSLRREAKRLELRPLIGEPDMSARDEDAVGAVVHGEEDLPVTQAGRSGSDDVGEDCFDRKVRLELRGGAEDPVERFRAEAERLARLVKTVPQSLVLKEQRLSLRGGLSCPLQGIPLGGTPPYAERSERASGHQSGSHEGL